MNIESICSVMVLYEPDIGVRRNILNLLLQVNHLILVDNTCGMGGGKWLLDISANESVTLISNNENFGVAKALNIGLKEANMQGYDFAVLMDQDTFLLPKAVESLASIYQKAVKGMKVCMVGSAHYGDGLDVASKEDYKVVKTVITSGTLVCLDVYQKVGMFDEKYFIDQVDHEYCLRALNMGYVNVISAKKLMLHIIGEPSVFSMAGFKVRLSNHSALRRYYFTRNKVFLLKEHFLKQPVFTLLGIINIIKNIILVVLFESDKLAKLGLIFSGFKDGVLNVSGKKELKK